MNVRRPVSLNRRSQSVKIDAKRQPFRAVKVGTRAKNGSSLDLLYLTHYQRPTNIHMQQLRWFGQSQSPFTDWRVNNGEKG